MVVREIVGQAECTTKQLFFQFNPELLVVELPSLL